jgi:hypothetical protein
MKAARFAGLTILVVVSSAGLLSAPRSAAGNGPQRPWKYSIVLAEVMVPPRRPPDGKEDTIVLRPIGTLSGPLDASRFAELRATIGQTWGLFVEDEPTAKGQMLLAVIAEIDGYHVFPRGFRFMHISDRGMRVIRGFADPKVLATLKDVQDAHELENRRRTEETARIEKVIKAMSNPRARDAAREALKNWLDAAKEEDAAFDGSRPPASQEGGITKYWLNHAVIFAEVKAVGKGKSGENDSFVVLRPKLTLAGAFDAGTTPVVTAAADFTKFAPKKPAAGDDAIVVLDRQRDSYRVAAEQPDYMPEIAGRRGPLSVVKGSSDPAVSKTIDLLKVRRRAEREENGKQ